MGWRLEPAGEVPVPKDAESGGSNFTEKVTALWPPRRPRTEQPSVERTTVKAHVLAHVARSRRKPGAGPDARPEFALPWNRKQPLELPLPPTGELPRGSQTTPRLDGDQAPPAVVAPSVPAATAAPRAMTASEASGPLAAPAASAADAWVDPTPARGAADTVMPPLYAGISPYRHSLPATLFELTAVSSAPATARPRAPATAWPPLPARTARPERSRRRGRARPSHRAAHAHHARHSLHRRPLAVLIFLLAVFLWAVAYWQTWTALSMTERCRAAWQMLSGASGSSPADDGRGHGPGI